MGWRLAEAGDGIERDAVERGFIKRFDPRYWTVNFPRPMMAAATTPAPGALRVDAMFLRRGDLAGLIWTAEDGDDHPLLRYETARDFRECTLRFRWRSSGVVALDAIHGAVLTIEGRDENGDPRAWFVRLWNYAAGDAEDATVTVDFGNVAGGFSLPAEADPVWAGDVDRMFVSLVAPDYAEGDETPLDAPVEGWAELSDILCDGPGSVLAIGDCIVPPHGFAMATGYDDLYHLTPERMLRNILQLGYRGTINHYVGMSHFPRLAWDAGAGRYLAIAAGGALNDPCTAWHRDFAAKAGALQYEVIWSLSYELLDQHCPEAWKQRAENGDPALTGWEPPSALLSPANAAAMEYLRDVARAFVAIASQAGLDIRFQIGEPWWWVVPGEGRICIYDESARAAFGGDPVSIADVRLPLDAAQRDLLDRAGQLLAASTHALRDAVKAVAPGAEMLILVYLPTVLDAEAPDLKRANVPVGWASPAFDRLQLEDYDWVTAGATASTEHGIGLASARLGYPLEEQHYFAGFVLNAEDRGQWRAIHDAALAARGRGTRETFIWALPQVIRDGFTLFSISEEERRVQAFDDVDFPIAIGRRAMVEPVFSTAIVTTAAGREQRNVDWADARMRYDAGPGIRAQADVETLIAFFRARHGAARGFRFRDPLDHSSRDMTGPSGPTDQQLGEGDGIRTRFDLIKRYGDQVRRISRPVTGSVSVAVNGAARADGWSLGTGGAILFAVPPPQGADVTAGYLFDVPVRFAEDRLEAALAAPEAGEAASVPLVEIREG